MKRLLARLRAGAAGLVATDRIATLATFAAALACALQAWSDARWFTGYPADGPFQTFNPLRRMAAGELPGRDFPVFHGIGIYWALYPGFRLFGGDLFASELARRLLPPLLLLLALRFVLRGLGLGRAAAGILAATAVLVSIAGIAGSVFDPAGLDRADLPGPIIWLSRFFNQPYALDAGNSLIGLRVALPLLGLALARTLAARAGALPWTRPPLLAGALAGAGVWWSCEQGAAAALALGAGWLLFPPGRPVPARRLAGAVLCAGAAAASALLLFTLSTGFHPGAALRYVVLDLPADQQWYFSAPPNRYLHDLRLLDLGYAGHFKRILLLAAVALAATPALRNLRPAARESLGFAAVLLLYALISAGAANLGLLSPHYLTAMHLVLFAVACVALAALAVRIRAARFPPATHVRAARAAIAARALLLAATLAALAFLTVQGERLALSAAAGEITGATGYRPELGVALGGTYAGLPRMAAIVSARPAPVIAATYAGPLEVMSGARRAARADYIVHALGERGRAAWLAEVRAADPDFVHLMRADFFPYEQWLQYDHWPFYRFVLSRYRPAAIGLYSVLWERAPAPPAAAPACITPPPPLPATRSEFDASNDFDHRNEMLATPAPEPALWEATIRYRMDNPWRGLPLLSGLPHAAVGFPGSLNQYDAVLPPARGAWTLPVFANGAGQPEVKPALRSLLPGARFAIEAVRWCRIEVPTERLLALFRPDDPRLDALRHPVDRRPWIRPHPDESRKSPRGR